MSATLLMSDVCLISLTKNTKDLKDKTNLRKFIQPWPGVDKFTDNIFACIHQSTSHGTSVPTKIAKKETLKAAHLLKKTKFIDDEMMATAAKIQALQDQ